MSNRGHLVYVGVHLLNNDDSPGRGRMCVLDLPMYTVQLTNSTYRKLLEFLADDDSGQLTGPIIFDAPDHSRGVVSVQIEDGNTSFVHISHLPVLLADSVIFDTRNCTFYEFPELPGISNLKVRWCMPFSGRPIYTHRELPAPFQKGCAYQVTHRCALRQSIFRQGAAGTGVHASR